MPPLRCPQCDRDPIFGHTLEERRAHRYAQGRANNRKYKKPRGPLVNTRLDTTHMRRIMRPNDAREQQGRAMGGHTTQATGACQTRFTSEKGRQAALARWARRMPTGRALGQFPPPPGVSRAPLRAQHTAPTLVHIGARLALVWYVPESGHWIERSEHGERVIGERTALMRLGHLRRWYRSSEGVPVEMWPIRPPKS